MKLLIEIPKEFEEHFKQDKFADSLHRLSADAHLVAGRYEQELAEMLTNAFTDSQLYEEKWIPVSEKLPQKGEQVLCCNTYGSVFTSAITYISDNGRAKFGQHYDIVAWQPLLEPYCKEREEEKRIYPECGRQL